MVTETRNSSANPNPILTEKEREKLTKTLHSLGPDVVRTGASRSNK